MNKYFGDRNFYKRVLSLTIPIMIQNGITNFVNMLDNVMVGKVGTVEMTGVAVTNQLIFVFNLCVFGIISGAGIFGAQYFGNGDNKGVQYTFRFKIITCTVLTALAAALFIFKGDSLIMLYLKGEGRAEDIAASLGHARNYLFIMLIGLLPYTIAQCYSSTLRETDHAVVPMTAGIVAVSVNLVLNYALIFGHFGALKMGVEGAAIATVISRFAELITVAVWTGVNKIDNEFIEGAFKSFKVPLKLVKQIFVKGLPLMANESVWGIGVALINQRFSLLGFDVVSANNIAQTFSNVFSVSFISIGAAVGIILGQLLGAGKKEEAKIASSRLITFAVLVSVAVGAVFMLCAQFIPEIYNTSASVKKIATGLMVVYACVMPIEAFINSSYFTLRSGGKVFITMLFDSIYVWVVTIPFVVFFTSVFSLPIIPLYAFSQALGLGKCLMGYILVKKGIWIKQIVI